MDGSATSTAATGTAAAGTAAAGTAEATARIGLSPREQELIASAYRVFSRQGGHRTSLQDIADDAGVSKGLLLYHFRSKEQLLLQTMRWALLRTADRIRGRLAKARPEPHEALTALVDAIFVGAQQNRDFYLLYLDLVEHAARAPSFSELPAMTDEIVVGLYRELIRDGVERGVFHLGDEGEDVEAAALGMRSYIDGVFLTWLQQRRWQQTHARFKQLCLDGLTVLLAAR